MQLRAIFFTLAFFLVPTSYAAKNNYCLHGGIVDPNNPPTCNNTDLNSAVSDLSDDINTESTARQNADASTLSSANGYTDGKVTAESAARQNADASTLSSANGYTDGKVTAESAARQNADASTLSSANGYTDGKVTAESAARQNADASTLSSANGYTDGKVTAESAARQNADASTLSASKNYTDASFSSYWKKSEDNFNKVNSRIDKLNNKMNAAIASSAAIASIPYVAEDSFSLGIGTGNYSNGNALAAGAQYKTSINSNVRVNFSWDSTGQITSGAGIAVGW
ncbi:YadA C-terminal domain-containing protein [Erwinia aphidicola]|uniref:YadA C-terminal domain-containing protein n=1 Tax=Erwinia aphidicola TaxID=68334 RepID=UPI0030D3685F